MALQYAIKHYCLQNYTHLKMDIFILHISRFCLETSKEKLPAYMEKGGGTAIDGGTNLTW